MQFTRDIVEHPDELRKSIFRAALSLTPLDVSLQDCSKFDPEMLKSCKSYHSFIVSMLQDMYDNPQRYGFRPNALEEFLDGRKINYYKQKAPSKLEPLLVETRDGVYSYYRFLYEIAANAVVSNDRLILSNDAYQNILLQFGGSTAGKGKKKSKDLIIPYPVRIDALKHNGFILTENADAVEVSSGHFPDMLLAMHELAVSAAKIKVFGQQGFNNCEFRQIYQVYYPDFDDIIQPLTDYEREVARKFHKIARDSKMSASYKTFWKANYKYKGRQVMQLLVNGNELRVLITGTNSEAQIQCMNELLLEEDSAFQKYVMKYLHYCLACSSTHLGCFIHVLGRRVRVCSNSIRLVKLNPTLEDVNYFQRFIELRKKVIASCD